MTDNLLLIYQDKAQAILIYSDHEMISIFLVHLQENMCNSVKDPNLNIRHFYEYFNFL